MGKEIAKLQSHIISFIEEKGIDKNHDGKINKDNGELAELLSQTGAENIDELMDMTTNKSLLCLIGGTTAVGAGFAANANKLAKVAKGPAWLNATAALCCMGISILSALYGDGTKKNQRFELKETKNQETQPETISQEPKTEIQKNYSNAFNTLGIDSNTPLREYIPQKGEHWTSILKAKYGVNDDTALRMAHSIKGAIYGDSLAAKQTPVMYLPQSWTFEGITYHYNDKTSVEKTENFSNDVKTEMGKMSKDLKYNN